MKPILVALSLCTLVAFPHSGHAASITYGAVEIIEGSDVDARRAAAEQACLIEASTPPRGTLRTQSLLHSTARRACLYRKGFFGEGRQAYPVPLFGTGSLRD
jgi:hypothetical protein